MWRAGQRMQKVLEHMMRIALFLDPRISPIDSRRAITLDLSQQCTFALFAERRSWISSLIARDSSGSFTFSDKSVVAASIHTDDRVALYALSRVADTLVDMRRDDWVGPRPESAKARVVRQTEANEKLDLLVTALDAAGFHLPAEYQNGPQPLSQSTSQDNSRPSVAKNVKQDEPVPKSESVYHDYDAGFVEVLDRSPANITARSERMQFADIDGPGTAILYRGGLEVELSEDVVVQLPWSMIVSWQDSSDLRTLSIFSLELAIRIAPKLPSLWHRALEGQQVRRGNG